MTKRHDLSDQYPPIVQAGIEFLKPRHLPNDLKERQAVYAFSIILMVLLIFGCIAAVLARIIGLPTFNGDIVIVLTTGLYVLTRFGLHKVAIYLAIALATMYPALVSQLEPRLFSNTMIISSALLTVLGTYLLTNLRTMLQVIVLNGFILIVLSLTVEDLAPIESVNTLLAYMLITVLIAALALLNERDAEFTQEKLEKNTRERDDWFQLVERLPQPILLASEHEIIYANRAMVRLLGGTYQHDVTSRTLNDFLPEKTTARLHQENSQFTMAYYQTLQRLDGTLMNVSATLRPIEYNNKLATLMTWQERTEPVSSPKRIHNLDVSDDLMFDYVYRLRIEVDKPVQFAWLVGGYEAILGVNQQTVLAREGWDSFVHEYDLPHYQRYFTRLLQGNEQSTQYRVVRPDGTTRWIQDRARPVSDHQGNIQYVVGAAHDITEKMHLENTLQTHIVQQAVVAELGLLALSTNEISEMLNHSVVLIQQVLEIDFSTVTMYDPQDKTLQVVADTGLYGQEGMLRRFNADPEKSCAAYALAQGETIVSSNLATETRYAATDHLTQHHVKSQVSVVIHGHTSPYGVLCVHHQELREFSEDDLYFLQSIANVVGTFIESYEARAAEREQREFAEALRDATVVLNSQLDFSQALSKMLEFLEHVIPQQDAASVMLVNDDATVQIPITRGYSEEIQQETQSGVYEAGYFPLLTHVVNTQQSLKLDDVHDDPRWRKFHMGGSWGRSAIIVPIIISQRVVGILNVVSRKVGNFSDEDVERLRVFADKTGNAVINARRAEELEREVQLRTLELKREQAHLQAILDSTGDGIFYTEGTLIRYANQALANMTGYEVQDFLDQPSTILQPQTPDAQTLKKLHSITDKVLDGDTWRDEIQLGRRDGTAFDAGLTVSKLDNMESETESTVTIVRDISQEKELVRQQQRFIANAAHELRSPISTLNTRLYLMQRKPDEMERHITLLDRVIKRMNRLVSDLLDVASFENGNLVLRKEAVILQEVITSVTDVQDDEALQKQITLDMNLADDPIHVLGDAARLEQVFTNLITNAITYTPEQGRITVTCAVDGQMVQVKVDDTGQGISPEHLPHIFQAFFRAETKQRGTGLGLHISKDIVQLHGGKIWVESTIGEGSSFIITLPLLTEVE